MHEWLIACFPGPGGQIRAVSVSVHRALGTSACADVEGTGERNIAARLHSVGRTEAPKSHDIRLPRVFLRESRHRQQAQLVSDELQELLVRGRLAGRGILERWQADRTYTNWCGFDPL